MNPNMIVCWFACSPLPACESTNASPRSGPISILSGRHSPCVEASPTSTGVFDRRPTKTYATRTITLPDAIRTQLLDLKNSKSATALVFPSRGGVYRRYGNWRRDVWDPACKTSGVSARPHDLRATYASLLIDGGQKMLDRTYSRT